jgi:hypothetical protein
MNMSSAELFPRADMDASAEAMPGSQGETPSL